MSASIPVAVQQRIAALRKQGRRINDIAAELQLGRHTVAGYCAKFDRGQALHDAPAATLDAGEVAALRALLAEAASQRQQLALISRSLVSLDCPHCRSSTAALRSQSTPRCATCRAVLRLDSASEIARREPFASAEAKPIASMGWQRPAGPDQPRPREIAVRKAVDGAFAPLNAQLAQLDAELAPLLARIERTESSLRRR